MEKILIIGKGFLGITTSIIAKTKNFQVFEASQKSDIRIDITNIESVEHAVKKTSPDIILNCAALTQVDEIEENPKNAFEVN